MCNESTAIGDIKKKKYDNFLGKRWVCNTLDEWVCVSSIGKTSRGGTIGMGFKFYSHGWGRDLVAIKRYFLEKE